MNTLTHLINKQASLTPDNTYVTEESTGQILTYAQLLTSCLAVSQVLSKYSMSPGDTVSIVMPNGLNTLRLLLAGMWGGMCVNPVNLLAQTDQMRYVIEHSDCKLVIVSPEWEEKIQHILNTIDRPIHLLVVSSEMSLLPDEKWLPISEAYDLAQTISPTIEPHNPALLMYTSGTTGTPKGVVLTQSQLAHNALSIAAEHQLTRHDNVLAVLPLYHINAFMVTMLTPLVSGGSLVLVAKFSVGRFWDQAVSRQCTWINLVPTMVSYLLEHQAPDLKALSAIKFCRSASASLPPEHLKGFEKKFGIGVIETMGLTETAAPCFSNPLLASDRKLGSVGKQSGCLAQVIDEHFNPVKDGVIGEVVVKGGNVMLGYYKNDKATASTFTPDGWLRTGDLGYRDSDGFFFITGRIKELIIKGGENIAPREIDEVLLKHPDVLDAATVGVDDKHYGQEIMACVVLRANSSPNVDDLRLFCQTSLGPFKTPKFFYFVNDLPRGPSGKVQRLKLPEFIKTLSTTVSAT